MTMFRNVALGTLLSVVAMLLVFGTTDTAEAANIVVDTFADIVDDDGSCSLREAITSANTNTASGSTSGECAAGGSSDAISLGAGTYALALSGAGEDTTRPGTWILAPT
jgi:CSLREA domain-containing protein